MPPMQNGEPQPGPSSSADNPQPSTSVAGSAGQPASDRIAPDSSVDPPIADDPNDDGFGALDPVERDFRRELAAIKKSGLNVSQHLIQLCRRGDWLAIDNLLRFVNEDEFDLDEVAPTTGWSPVMFAAKENQVNIVDRLLDIGFDVNAQANVILSVLN